MWVGVIKCGLLCIIEINEENVNDDTKNGKADIEAGHTVLISNEWSELVRLADRLDMTVTHSNVIREYL